MLLAKNENLVDDLAGCVAWWQLPPAYFVQPALKCHPFVALVVRAHAVLQKAGMLADSYTHYQCSQDVTEQVSTAAVSWHRGTGLSPVVDVPRCLQKSSKRHAPLSPHAS